MRSGGFVMSQIKKHYDNAMLELKAIDSVRIELAFAVQTDAGNITISEIHARLMSLYASLNIDNIESIIQSIDYKKAA